jgi:23S rRNA pseudouridine1911/1915/1917 synthase
MKMDRKQRRQPPARIIHADEHLLVVDKPPGVVAVSARGEPAVADLLRASRAVPPDEPFRVIHRLDKDASGVQLYARTLEAQRHLREQFAERRIEKVYLALVQGYVEGDGEIDLPLLPNRDNTRVKVSRRGKLSLTRYRVAERLGGHTLLECRPLTGRLHQIRAHLAAIGHPLAVDPLYGGGKMILLSQFKADYRPNRRREERPLIDRLTLHASRITFEHPDGSGPLTFESALPKDFRATLNQLRRV